MGTATQTLVLIVTSLVSKVGDDDGKLTAALAEVQAAEAREESEIQALRDAFAALPAPFDPSALEARISALEGAATGTAGAVDLGPLTARVQALEDRNADDDAAAGALPAVGVLQGLPDGMGTAAIAIDTTPLTEPVLGAPYAAQVVAGGGVSPYQFSMLSGALPPGLSMAAGGAITGTPATAGAFAFEVQVHDANGAMASGGFTLTIADPASAFADGEGEHADAPPQGPALTQ